MVETKVAIMGYSGSNLKPLQALKNTVFSEHFQGHGGSLAAADA